ncbi:YhgE/Pip domain-containing protein [Furfurilactobacillus rossiae]|uniref:YhgE/Pip domain-containing protein n=1 Tax=Furfurilactobacillus rossiae TaxID=231049 RepID=UPI003B97F717
MMKGFTIFKQPFVWAFMLIAILCSIFFSACLLPAFHVLPSRTDQIPVVVINQDSTTMGKTVTQQLIRHLPFKHIRENQDLATSKTQLNNRHVGLIIRIPATFSKDIKAGRTTHLHYYVNNANSLIQNNMNKSLISNATNSISANVTTNKAKGMFAKVLGPQIAAKAQQQFVTNPAAAHLAQNPQAMAAAKKTMTNKVKRSTMMAATKMSQALSKGVSPITHTSNSLPTRTSYQMAPMTLQMGTYLGTLLMSVLLVALFMVKRFSLGKWSSFLATQCVGLLNAIVLPFASVTTLHLLISMNSTIYWQLLSFNIVSTMVIFEFTYAIATIFAGLPSMIIQIPLFILQVVTGGIIVPHLALNGFYRFIAATTPMYAAMTGSQNILFGGGQTGNLLLSLIWLGLLSFVISAVAIAVGFRSNKPAGIAKVFA